MLYYLRKPADVVYQLSSNSANLLRSWKKSYIDTRAYIENSGVGSRWEFDKAILFEEVDHIAKISQDIADVAKIFIQFENMFGNHLKSIVKEPEEVDNMLKKAFKLVNLILQIDYDVFRPSNLENWEATLEYFKKHVEILEVEAKFVLDRSIQSLRSAEQGLSLIRDTQASDTRKAFIDHMSTKHESVMRQFISELGIVEYEFLVRTDFQSKKHLMNLKKLYFREIVKIHHLKEINHKMLEQFSGNVYSISI